MRANNGDVHSTLSRNAVSLLVQPPPAPLVKISPVGKYLSFRPRKIAKIFAIGRYLSWNREANRKEERLILFIPIYSSIDRSKRVSLISKKKNARLNVITDLLDWTIP